MVNKKAFTLLEVLIAGGILFVVSAGIVGLSNSIIRGTTITNDATITNRWASEGLELTTKIRDEKAKTATFASGEGIWFGDPAVSGSNYTNSSNYGWHYLKPDQVKPTWSLEPLAKSYQNIIDLNSFNPSDPSLLIESLSANNLIGYRLICIESYGAVVHSDEDILNCNTDVNGNIVSDGNRIPIPGPECHDDDLFCRLTKPSLNKTETGGIIPDGNAVKVRSVVLWGDRGTLRKTDIATILTNWRSIAN